MRIARRTLPESFAGQAGSPLPMLSQPSSLSGAAPLRRAMAIAMLSFLPSRATPAAAQREHPVPPARSSIQRMRLPQSPSRGPILSLSRTAAPPPRLAPLRSVQQLSASAARVVGPTVWHLPARQPGTASLVLSRKTQKSAQMTGQAVASFGAVQRQRILRPSPSPVSLMPARTPRAQSALLPALRPDFARLRREVRGETAHILTPPVVLPHESVLLSGATAGQYMSASSHAMSVAPGVPTASPKTTLSWASVVAGNQPVPPSATPPMGMPRGTPTPTSRLLSRLTFLPSRLAPASVVVPARPLTPVRSARRAAPDAARLPAVPATVTGPHFPAAETPLTQRVSVARLLRRLTTTPAAALLAQAGPVQSSLRAPLTRTPVMLRQPRAVPGLAAPAPAPAWAVMASRSRTVPRPAEAVGDGMDLQASRVLSRVVSRPVSAGPALPGSPVWPPPALAGGGTIGVLRLSEPRRTPSSDATPVLATPRPSLALIQRQARPHLHGSQYQPQWVMAPLRVNRSPVTQRAARGWQSTAPVQPAWFSRLATPPTTPLSGRMRLVHSARAIQPVQQPVRATPWRLLMRAMSLPHRLARVAAPGRHDGASSGANTGAPTKATAPSAAVFRPGSDFARRRHTPTSHVQPLGESPIITAPQIAARTGIPAGNTIALTKGDDRGFGGGSVAVVTSPNPSFLSRGALFGQLLRAAGIQARHGTTPNRDGADPAPPASRGRALTLPGAHLFAGAQRSPLLLLSANRVPQEAADFAPDLRRATMVSARLRSQAAPAPTAPGGVPSPSLATGSVGVDRWLAPPRSLSSMVPPSPVQRWLVRTLAASPPHVTPRAQARIADRAWLTSTRVAQSLAAATPDSAHMGWHAGSVALLASTGDRSFSAGLPGSVPAETKVPHQLSLRFAPTARPASGVTGIQMMRAAGPVREPLSWRERRPATPGVGPVAWRVALDLPHSRQPGVPSVVARQTAGVAVSHAGNSPVRSHSRPWLQSAAPPPSRLGSISPAPTALVWPHSNARPLLSRLWTGALDLVARRLPELRASQGATSISAARTCPELERPPAQTLQLSNREPEKWPGGGLRAAAATFQQRSTTHVPAAYGGTEATTTGRAGASPHHSMLLNRNYLAPASFDHEPSSLWHRPRPLVDLSLGARMAWPSAPDAAPGIRARIAAQSLSVRREMRETWEMPQVPHGAAPSPRSWPQNMGLARVATPGTVAQQAPASGLLWSVARSAAQPVRAIANGAANGTLRRRPRNALALREGLGDSALRWQAGWLGANHLVAIPPVQTFLRQGGVASRSIRQQLFRAGDPDRTQSVGERPVWQEATPARWRFNGESLIAGRVRHTNLARHPLPTVAPRAASVAARHSGRALHSVQLMQAARITVEPANTRLTVAHGDLRNAEPSYATSPHATSLSRVAGAAALLARAPLRKLHLPESPQDRARLAGASTVASLVSSPLVSSLPANRLRDSVGFDTARAQRTPPMVLPPVNGGVAGNRAMQPGGANTGAVTAGPPQAIPAPVAVSHAAGAADSRASANEVDLLAREVWSLLKRRLATEKERMGLL